MACTLISYLFYRSNSPALSKGKFSMFQLFNVTIYRIKHFIIGLNCIVLWHLLSWLIIDFPRQWPWLEPRSDHTRFVADKEAWGMFSLCFDFPCHSFHRLAHLSSGAGTRGQIVAYVPNGLSLTPPKETKEKTTVFTWSGYAKQDLLWGCYFQCD
jgi:hypothetical protein